MPPFHDPPVIARSRLRTLPPTLPGLHDHAGSASMGYLLRNLSLLEPDIGTLQPGMEIRTDAGEIAEIGEGLSPGSAEVVDCGGRVVMPGLIDSHVHVMLTAVNTRALESVPLTLGTARAAASMRAMLDRGFTTVRDTGGRRLGPQTGGGRGGDPRAAAVHRGPGDRADRRPLGPAPAHGRVQPQLPLLQRDGLLDVRIRRRRARCARPPASRCGRAPTR